MTPHEQALANPTSKAKAIRAKCWDCQGRGADPAWQRHVRECTVQLCPLWHVRPYRSKDEKFTGTARPALPDTNTPF